MSKTITFLQINKNKFDLYIAAQRSSAFLYRAGVSGLAVGLGLASMNWAAHAQAVLVTNGTTVSVPGPLFPSSTYNTTAAGVTGQGIRSTSSSTVNAAGVTITTSGAGAAGINAATSGRIVMNAGSITTSGTDAPGIVAQSAGRIEINGGSITTQALTGNGSSAAYGVSLQGGNTVVELNDTLVSTAGTFAYGVRADFASRAVLTGSTVRTTGDNAHAVVANFAGAVITVNGSSVETTGVNATGIKAALGSTIGVMDSRVVTRGNSAIGLYSSAEGQGVAATMTASNVTVETFGTDARGATAFQSGSTLTLTGGSVTTHGANAHGVNGLDGATLSATNTAIVTTGQNARGANAFASGAVPGIVNLTNATVSTTGVGAHALTGQINGIVNASGTAVSTTGATAHGLFALEGGTVNYSGQVVTTSASSSAGIAFGFTAAGIHNTINVANATINAAGDGLLAATGNNVATLTGSTLNTGTGIAVHATGSSTTALLADSSTINGSALTATTAVMNATLRNNTLWNMTGTSNVTSLVNDASLIAFSPPTADPTLLGSYKTLTTRDYTGVGGTIGLNTFLGNDSAPSDRLVINGGAATGNSFLRIANTTGAGDLTTGNGILVVNATNGGTTTPGAFSLAGPVVAGPYEYSLYRSSRDAAGPQSWYLRSELTPQPPSPAPGPNPPPPQPSTGIPDYRRETSLYAALPAMQLIYGRTLLDSLHERVGELRPLEPAPVSEERTVWCKNPEKNFRCTTTVQLPAGAATPGRSYASSGWARIIGQHGNQDGGAWGIYRNGPNFDYDLFALQAGLDLYRAYNADGSRDHAGLYAAIGRIEGDVGHFNGIRAGRNSIDAYSIGGYWTHFGPSGWYLDGVVQGTWYDAKADSRRGFILNRDSFGFAASLEGGYPIALGYGVILEPQAQIVYQTITSGTASDTAALVRFSDADSLAGRVGARLARSWTLEEASAGARPRLLTAWLKASLWNEFLGNPKTAFSSATGFIPFNADLGGSWAEFKVGADAQLTKSTALYATAGYSIGLDGRSHAYDGRLGVKVSW